jgi:hypothetical protein
MKLETVRLVKAALADVTYGINAMLAALTLDGSDTRPANPTVYTDVDHKWVARRKVDDVDTAAITFPALAVFQFAPLRCVDVEVRTIVRDADVQIAFAYVVRKQDSAAAVRDALYFNRALLRWFKWFEANDQTSSFRTKNGVTLRLLQELTQDDVDEDWGSVNCIAATIATWRVRENSP